MTCLSVILGRHLGSPFIGPVWTVSKYTLHPSSAHFRHITNILAISQWNLSSKLRWRQKQWQCLGDKARLATSIEACLHLKGREPSSILREPFTDCSIKPLMEHQSTRTSCIYTAWIYSILYCSNSTQL